MRWLWLAEERSGRVGLILLHTRDEERMMCSRTGNQNSEQVIHRHMIGRELQDEPRRSQGIRRSFGD